MTWRLKDQSLQERLDSFSNGKFSKELEECADDIHSECIVLELDKYGDVELSVFVRPPALEKIPEYNPNDWNDIRKIKPPYNVMMRVDFGIDESIGFKAFYRKFLGGDGWCFADGKTMPESYSNTIARFRPWED